MLPRCSKNSNWVQVPNVKGVEHRSVAEIAADLTRLQALASQGHLPPADLAGGTLTVSNIGAVGGTYAMPLVHAPEVAIVALGRSASHSICHLLPQLMHIALKPWRKT